MDNEVSPVRPIASRIRKLRAERRWSAQRLAEECARAGGQSLTRGAIAKIESGRRNVTADEVTVLARVFAVIPSELLSPLAPSSAPRVADDVVLLLQRHRDKLPTGRKANIIMCGGTGSGKSTTINSLLGEDLGGVGYFSRGTSEDELYEWESKGHHIDLVDLPALGDTREREKEYREMYLRRVEQADGFIVVITPPRPANMATIRTVNLLLQCGVDPERIVFAYNRLGDINTLINGTVRRVALDGLAGPATPDDAQVIDMARKTFNSDLAREVRNGQYAHRFPLDRVIAYDAVSGWNLLVVLDAVLGSLPGDSPRSWRYAVTRGAPNPRLRKKAAAEHRRQLADLQKENERLAAELHDRRYGADHPSA